MKITESTPLRLAALSAIVCGACFVIVGLFHPVNSPPMVTTATWINVHIAAMLMCFFGTLGMTGLYSRHAVRLGVLGFIGYVFLITWFALVLCFSLIEAFVLPNLASQYPIFVESFLGMFSGTESPIALGVLPTIWMISGPLYILGPLLFGIAAYRAKVYPTYAALLLIAGSVCTLLGGMLPPEYQPIILIPVGLAIAYLGYSLFEETN